MLNIQTFLLFAVLFISHGCSEDEERIGCNVYLADNYDELSDGSCCCEYSVTYELKGLTKECLITYWEKNEVYTQMTNKETWQRSFRAQSGEWISLAGNFNSGAEVVVRTGNNNIIVCDTMPSDQSYGFTMQLK